jgi:hypothetical protein
MENGLLLVPLAKTNRMKALPDVIRPGRPVGRLKQSHQFFPEREV